MYRLNSSISKEFLVPFSMPCSSAVQTRNLVHREVQMGTSDEGDWRTVLRCFLPCILFLLFFMSSVTVLVWSKWTCSIFVTVFVLFVVQCYLLLVFYIIFIVSWCYSYHSLLCEWKDITSTCLQLLHTR